MLAHAFRGWQGLLITVLLALLACFMASKKRTEKQKAQKHKKMRKCRSKAPKRPPKSSQKWSRDVVFPTLANPWFRATLQWFCLIFMVLGCPRMAKKRLKTESKKITSKKTIKIVFSKKNRKKIEFGAPMYQKGCQKCSKTNPKERSTNQCFYVSLPSWRNWGPRVPQSRQNGSQGCPNEPP